MPEETITMTLAEYELSKQVAVHEKQLEILIYDYQDNKRELDVSLSSISAKITVQSNLQNEFMLSIPSKINECRNDLEKDLLEDIARTYITHGEITAMRNRIIGAVAGAVFIITIVDYLMTKTNFFGG